MEDKGAQDDAAAKGGGSGHARDPIGGRDTDPGDDAECRGLAAVCEPPGRVHAERRELDAAELGDDHADAAGATIALMSLVSKSVFNVRDEFDATLLELQSFEAKVQSGDEAFLNGVQTLLEDFRASIANGSLSLEDSCDVEFFADRSLELHESLVVTFALMDSLVEVFAILGTIAVAGYLLIKTVVTFNLSTEINREDMPISRADKAPINTNILGIGGQQETVNQRTTRVYLRSETMLYMLVNGLLDVPLITFVMTFFIMSNSRRGTSCAACFDRLELCNVSTFGDLDDSLKLALVLVIISLLWNASLLAERWVEFVRFKKEILGKSDNHQRYYIFWTLGLLVYTLVIITPMLILYFLEIGPKYFDLEEEQLLAMEIAGYTGASFWGISVLFLSLSAGIDPGEIISSPFICVEVLNWAQVQSAVKFRAAVVVDPLHH
eukprot:CAMPEP_0184532602 /NCGR_PEP_ID=MMETSP0198_2-20121128/14258_1 /TAXON_ID=1112570 /ORGANISM="Thraustochytrium sp., Strain LLF1b" /LENGTH=437 /DNA_ID=CAMNT_0026925217 /DNA_START=66 /DNA_END=1382 /DNA_ORIENTATION=-